MFLLLLVLWVILNGKLNAEVLLLGIALSALISLFAVRCMGYSLRTEQQWVRKAGGLLRYCALLLFEIIKANRDVMRLILSPCLEPEPRLITVHIPLKSDISRVILANSITLTPGTITVSLEDDCYVIHCLDKELGEGIENSSFVQRLKKLEGKNG